MHIHIYYVYTICMYVCVCMWLKISAQEQQPALCWALRAPKIIALEIEKGGHTHLRDYDPRHLGPLLSMLPRSGMQQLDLGRQGG